MIERKAIKVACGGRCGSGKEAGVTAWQWQGDSVVTLTPSGNLAWTVVGRATANKTTHNNYVKSRVLSSHKTTNDKLQRKCCVLIRVWYEYYSTWELSIYTYNCNNTIVLQIFSFDRLWYSLTLDWRRSLIGFIFYVTWSIFNNCRFL